MDGSNAGRDETSPGDAPERHTRRRNMHEGVEVWDDGPCSCEPEPRWQAVREEQEQNPAQRGRQQRPAPGGEDA